VRYGKVQHTTWMANIEAVLSNVQAQVASNLLIAMGGAKKTD
jgi:hypothetical protein